MVLPYMLSRSAEELDFCHSRFVSTVAEGIVRIAIFLSHICGLISVMKDIQRVLHRYHGAEHKCINCIEHGLPSDC
ncbi:MAG: DUF1385 domain-containing protein [Coprococcus sp.]